MAHPWRLRSSAGRLVLRLPPRSAQGPSAAPQRCLAGLACAAGSTRLPVCLKDNASLALRDGVGGPQSVPDAETHQAPEPPGTGSPTVRGWVSAGAVPRTTLRPARRFKGEGWQRAGVSRASGLSGLSGLLQVSRTRARHARQENSLHGSRRPWQRACPAWRRKYPAKRGWGLSVRRSSLGF